MKTGEWQRVSPIALIYFLLGNLRQAVNAWPALLALIAGGEGLRSNFIAFGLPLLLLLFAFSTFLHFWLFRFKVEGDRIQLQSGVLNRKKLTLEFERVQQADIAQPFYFRPFGLATLGLESAGSAGQEVNIPGLPFRFASDVKQRILEHHRKVPVEQGDPQAQVAADFEIHLPWPEVARYGLMFNGLIFLAPVLAPLLNRLNPSMEQWLLALQGTPLQQWAAGLSASAMAWLVAAGAVLLFLLALLLIFGASVVVALWRFWDYRLTRRGDRYQYRAGLGTVTTRGFRAHKMQLVGIFQGAVARMLKRHSLAISKAGGRTAGGQAQNAQRFLVPVLDDKALAQMKQQLGIPAPRWQGVSAVYFFQRALLWTALLSATVLVIWGSPHWPWVVAVTALVSMFCAWRRWRCLAVSMDADWLALRQGFIGFRQAWLPLVKLQKVTLSEPPWLKPWGLASVTLWSADGRLHLPCLPRAMAKTIRDRSLHRVVTFHGAWL